MVMVVMVVMVGVGGGGGEGGEMRLYNYVRLSWPSPTKPCS